MLHKTQKLKETPSQTAGPYVAIGMAPNVARFADIKGVFPEDLGTHVIGPDTPGERITVVIRLIDGDGVPASDAMIETWQADASGKYVAFGETRADGFTGFGRRAMTDERNEFVIETVKPGRVPGPDGRPMAPHLLLWIVARGINIGLQSRLYFEDEPHANAEDFVLNKILNPARRPTLIARKDGGSPTRYVLDIHLQGPHETVFFDV
ncbi:MAG: protocatechuate 3,4-dioxygenase subunit alpha [Alphaproteobacteria bacterium]|nr:protocatechuate 3,4-dioxygenase subunit alpha [Alphaproteobacteria bacterium]